jgi:hypothetical protein
MSAIGGKADMTFCAAHVRLRPKADIRLAPLDVRCWVNRSPGISYQSVLGVFSNGYSLTQASDP